MRYLKVCLLIIIFSGRLAAQGNLNVPEASQLAGVSQRIGLTDIQINYHSPLVKGRVIWGEVVPFGEVWRAGANENTTISFSTAVKVEGKPLPAGTYGLHMIPSKTTWTIIFSSNSNSWGSYFYDQSEDVLRVDVNPEAAQMQEWLSFRFTDVKSTSAKAMLNWEKIAVGFFIEVNVPETVVRSMRDELRGNKGFTWEANWQAADYCYRNKILTEDALKWVDKSISITENFHNLNTKALLLASVNKTKESAEFKSKALNVATEPELNAYGYQLLAGKKVDEAIEVFKLNTQRHPESWNVYDSLGESLEIKGDNKNAVTNYKLALKKAPEAQKKRIQASITKLEKKS